MLGFFRGFLNTWPAKVFFLVLALAFTLWGVAPSMVRTAPSTTPAWSRCFAATA